MQALIPSVITEKDLTIDDIVEIYKDDLPAPNNCEEEFTWCKKGWSIRDISERSQTIAQALKQCDNDAYPNLSVILKIAGTVAVTSCECKRSGSVLKRLNAYLRTSIKQERLSELALMHISYDVKINVDQVMSTFVKNLEALEFSNNFSK